MDYNYNEQIITNSYSTYSKKKTFIIDLDIYRLNTFKNLIMSFFKSNKSWNYYISKESQRYSTIIVDNLEKIRWYNCPKLNNNNILDFNLHICFDCKKFDKISIQTFFSKKKEYNSKADEINFINNFFYNKILELYKFAQNALLVENYFFESFQIKTGEVSGYYDFDKIKLDCGERATDYTYPRIIKCQIKYYKAIVNELGNKMVVNETIDIDRKIILILIQMFSRCAYSNKITNGRYIGKSYENLYELNDENKGKFISLNRDQISIEHYEEIPDDTNFLINKFYDLNYDKQNVFLVACEAYIEGLKENTGKALTSFVIAIESLANHKFKNKRTAENKELSKKEKIYNLIFELFDYEMVSQEYINYVYYLRCLYSHEAVANNQIKNIIFDVDDVEPNLILDIEALTYSILIKWIIKEG